MSGSCSLTTSVSEPAGGPSFARVSRSHRPIVRYCIIAFTDPRGYTLGSTSCRLGDPFRTGSHHRHMLRSRPADDSLPSGRICHTGHAARVQERRDGYRPRDLGPLGERPHGERAAARQTDHRHLVAESRRNVHGVVGVVSKRARRDPALRGSEVVGVPVHGRPRHPHVVAGIEVPLGDPPELLGDRRVAVQDHDGLVGARPVQQGDASAALGDPRGRVGLLHCSDSRDSRGIVRGRIRRSGQVRIADGPEEPERGHRQHHSRDYRRRYGEPPLHTRRPLARMRTDPLLTLPTRAPRPRRGARNDPHWYTNRLCLFGEQRASRSRQRSRHS